MHKTAYRDGLKGTECLLHVQQVLAFFCSFPIALAHKWLHGAEAGGLRPMHHDALVLKHSLKHNKEARPCWVPGIRQQGQNN